MLTISGGFRVFQITLGLQPYIHREFNSCFLLIGLVDNVLFSLLDSIPIFSEGNIVNHISAKDKLAWCCLQCCVIGASNRLFIIQLIEGSNQMNYFVVLLYFNDYFPSQMI
jgi:hypothetical protein